MEQEINKEGFHYTSCSISALHKNMGANNFSNMVAQGLASYIHWLADKKEKLSSEEQYPYQA